MYKFFAIIALILLSSNAFASQPQYQFDLRDLMDAHYGVGNWTERTAPHVGTDIGPALQDGKNQIYATMKNRGGIINIPSGNWLMITPPDDLSGINLIGVGATLSVIVFDNASGVALNYTGGSSNGNSIVGIGLLLETGLGDTISYGIMMRGNAQFQPDNMTIYDVYMSSIGGTSYWWDGIHIDGSARTTPQGIRVTDIQKVSVFVCRNLGILLSDVVQLRMDNVGVYVGKGPYANTILINSFSVHIYGIAVNALLNIGGASIDVWINGTRYYN